MDSFPIITEKYLEDKVGKRFSIQRNREETGILYKDENGFYIRNLMNRFDIVKYDVLAKCADKRNKKIFVPEQIIWNAFL